MVQIHVCEPPGDILVFLTGEEEIEDACKKIAKEITQMGEQARPRPPPQTRQLLSACVFSHVALLVCIFSACDVLHNGLATLPLRCYRAAAKLACISFCLRCFSHVDLANLPFRCYQAAAKPYPTCSRRWAR